MPTPQQVLHDPHTLWTRLILPWYGQMQRELEIACFTTVWFHYGLPAVSIRCVLIRDVAGKFEPQALLSTDPLLTPEQILAFFLRRWQMEPTFQHIRTHLGVETQRQWSDKAIARTTPALLGLFSLVTLLADTLITHEAPAARAAAWYPKSLLTFPTQLPLFVTNFGHSGLFTHRPMKPTWQKSLASYSNASTICCVILPNVQSPAKTTCSI